MHLLQRTGQVILAGLFGIGIFFASNNMSKAQTSPGQQDNSKVNWQAHKLGPKSSVSVYWVGHSLVEAKAETEQGQITLMSLLGTFATAKNLDYNMGDHTLWGSPLSALWRGNPHGYKRDASSMVKKRRSFEKDAARYDTLLLTEAIPLRPTMKYEFSSYYLRQFYCVIKKANPSSRVYLYETWVNFQAADKNAKFPPAHRFNWRHEMSDQRTAWLELADAARKPSVKSPGWLSSLGINSTTDAGCLTEDPIFIVPVGSTFLAIDERLASPRPDDNFTKPDGSKLKTADLFSNPYINWPENWPREDQAEIIDPETTLSGLKLADPSKPHDDIHPSALGIYVSALVHYATLYRRSPVGLPTPAYIGEGLGKTLQCIAWQTVLNEPRSGVTGKAPC